MPDIYDFLSALHQGTWEVVIPKSLLTTPLGPEWKPSAINVPTPDTVASYRNGQYHAHETKTEYRVHLDRYDPKKNPFLHLIDDAPLILMIYETVETLYVTGKDTRRKDMKERLQEQQITWKIRVVTGIGLITASIILGLMAINQSDILFSAILPGLVGIFGIFLVATGIIQRARNEHSNRDIFNGLLMIGGSIIMFLFWHLYFAILFILLSLWVLSSAYVTITRIMKNKKNIPQGMLLTLGMGIGSLALGIYSIIDPGSFLTILIILLAAIIFLAGLCICIDGYGLWNAGKLMKKSEMTLTV
ncbi:MAG: hypothetical protein LUQ07_06830 [Methanospirillum sp.]|nr:hypothetical protein [Methanospirillum sp.]